MQVVDHTTLRHMASNGVERVVAARPDMGAAGFEVWIERIAPGARTRLAGSAGADLSVLVVHGSGQVREDGRVREFAAPCRLLLDALRRCEIHNQGAEMMQLVIAFATP